MERRHFPPKKSFVCHLWRIVQSYYEIPVSEEFSELPALPHCQTASWQAGSPDSRKYIGAKRSERTRMSKCDPGWTFSVVRFAEAICSCSLVVFILSNAASTVHFLPRLLKGVYG